MPTLRTIRILLCVALALLPAGLLYAQDDDAPAPTVAPTMPPAPGTAIHSAPPDRTLTVGESDILTYNGMTTAAVGSPAVVDIVPLSARRLLVSAKGVGQTTLFVVDGRGSHRLRLAVIASLPDLAPVAAQIQAEIGLPGVTARAIKDTVFLEGTVTGVVALQRASAIAGVYAPRIKNLIAVVPDKDDGAEPSLAQTYAALLTSNLPGTGIKVQVVDDHTIALLGEYAPPRSAAETETGKNTTTKTTTKARYHRTPAKSAAGSDPGADTPDSNDTAPGDMAMDLSDAASARTDGPVAADPLDRLIQSLPSDLKVIDLLNLVPRPARQILVKAKIIDIDRTASKSLGINWGTLNPLTARSGAGYEFQSQPILFGQNVGQTSNIFYPAPLGGGSLERIAPFAAQLNLLISENKARILSEPSLMVLDGNSGSILVGGEIPIPVAQGSSGTSGISSSVTIQYKPYGVRLLVSAALVGDNAVQITVTPEVSELNYTNAVQISGFTIPALTVRRATSTLQMGDGETLVIGGLYSNTASREVERIPLLSQIPILGEFFKNTVTRKDENELLIIIQPQIVTRDTPGAHPPPPGSPENPPIAKPDVGSADFNKDFPIFPKGGR